MNGGGNFRNFLVERNILVRNFADFINENPQSVNILYINITKEDSPSFLRENDSVDNKGKKVKYEDIEKMYNPSSTKSYNKGKTKLEKGLYMNKELIEEFFKTLKVRIRVNENQDTAGIGQMGR